MKLRTKFLLVFALVTGLSLLTVSFLGYFFAQKKVSENIQAEVGSVANAYVNQVDGWLQKKGSITEITANTIVQVLGDNPIPVAFVQEYKGRDKELMDLYVGLEDGSPFVEGEQSTLPPGYDPRTRGWYKKAKEKNTLIFTDAYVDAFTGKYIVSAATPLKNTKGAFRGVVGLDLSLDTLSAKVKEINVHGQGYGFIVDPTGMVLAHKDDKITSTNLKDNAGFAPVLNELISKDTGSFTINLDNVSQLVIYRKIPSTNWTLAIVVPEAVAFEQLISLKYQYVTANIAAIILALLVALFFSYRVTKPISELASHADTLASGDLTVKAEVVGEDEVAHLANAFNRMSDNLASLVRKINSSTQEVTSAAHDMQVSSNEAGKVSDQIATTINDLAKGSSDQAASVSKGAAMVQDMSHAISGIAENTAGSAQLAEHVNVTVDKGYNAVVTQSQLMDQSKQASANVGTAISSLVEKSQQIGQIVEVISGIAGQTNLLALNAAIEAARAGEQGRGFAVVADEVRKLAEQSATSSQEIINLIRDIQVGTEQAVTEIDSALSVVTDQEKAANKTKEYFERIRQAVKEMVEQIETASAGIQNINTKAKDVSVVITDIAAVSEEVAASTEEVSASTEEQSSSIQSISEQADSLFREVKALQREVEKFRI